MAINPTKTIVIAKVKKTNAGFASESPFNELICENRMIEINPNTISNGQPKISTIE
jgi:hypothetical protein